VPAERLLLALRALAELDVDDARAGEVHQLAERAAHVLHILDRRLLAASLTERGSVDLSIRRSR
jgi:hypothetical protein